MARPVVCFSYLAAAELWHVDRFPLPDCGAGIGQIEPSIAADGPMAAAVLAALGVPAQVLSNGLGADGHGRMVSARLKAYGVHLAPGSTAPDGLPTPRITVVADDLQTRTWFAYLPGVSAALAALDLAPLTSAAYAYIDCYQLIEAPAVRAIRAARAVGVPLLLNLGGSPLTPAVVSAVDGHPALAVQTSVGDADHADVSGVAAAILAATAADWAIVTAGAHGAVAVSRDQHIFAPAFGAEVRHTHCAGAAFSGGLLYGLLHGWPMRETLDLACASGALRCERAHHQPMPTLAELTALVNARERAMTSRRAS